MTNNTIKGVDKTQKIEPKTSIDTISIVLTEREKELLNKYKKELHNQHRSPLTTLNSIAEKAINNASTYFSINLQQWYASHAKKATLTAIKKALKIYEITGVFDYDGMRFSKYIEDKEAIELKLKSVHEIAADIESLLEFEVSVENNNSKTNGTNKIQLTRGALESIFNSQNNSFNVCKALMEDIELTIDGNPNPDLKKGRVGKLTGLISAIKQTPGMLRFDKATDNQLLSYFNDYLKTEYSTFSKRNSEYSISLDDAKRYINKHFKK